MLAYIFWHWPKPGVLQASYEERLSAFHDGLARRRPTGYVRSATFRSQGVPWLAGGGGIAYQDWYLLADTAALDTLNEAAVAGETGERHMAIAQDMAAGTAGLMRLRLGVDDVQPSRYGHWLAKPADFSYEAFFHKAETWLAGPDRGLWARQLTLGPGPEFCLLAPDKVQLPQELRAFVLPMRQVYPEAEE